VGKIYPMALKWVVGKEVKKMGRITLYWVKRGVDEELIS